MHLRGRPDASRRGLARRATAIEPLREQKPDTLVVDTGGSLTGESSGAGAQADKLYAQVFSELRYDAVNAGPGELSAAADSLKALAGGGTALLSGNGSADSPAAISGLLKPYVVKEVSGVRVAIVGVTSPGYVGGHEMAPKQPAVDALRALLPEIHKKADIVVVLADLDPSEVTSLASAGLGIQAILGARSPDLHSATVVGSTVVANAGGSGRNVEVLTLQVGQGGQVLGYQSTETSLDASVADDPGVVRLQQGK